MNSFNLVASDEIDWVSPNGLPQGFDTLTVYTCRRGGASSSPMEIAAVRYSQAGEPTLAGVKKVHSLRQNQRVTPVLVAILLHDGRVTLFEPTTSTAPTRPIELSQANRFLQAILDEATPVAARSRLQGLLQSLDTTAIPGLKNSGLFANHELRHGVPRRTDWQEACENSHELLSLREHELISRLGYSTEGLGSHALVLTGSGVRPEAIAVMLTDREAFDANSQRFSVSPVAYGLKMAEQAGVPWLILVRGGQLRLYPARIDLGVGRKGLAETFLEIDLPQLTDDNAGYLSLIFAAPALVDGGSAFEIMASSSQYAVALGARLRDKIYEDIVPRLSVAIANQLATLGYEMDAEGLDLAYQLTLRVFFRMLFQVYAEDRKLLPYGENERYDRHALKTVAKDLFEDPELAFDSESTSMWDDLAEVWRVIDSGDRAWGVPAYNGGLFGSDPELNSHGAIIHNIRVSNDVVGPCLKALLLDRSDDGEFGPIDFRSLSVREFGTIYEGLLESSLGLAEVDLTIDSEGTWLPAKSTDVVEKKAGEIYFHNTSGQRKGTGSYFTPSFVVEHLLERTLDLTLDEHLERVSNLLRAGDQTGAAALFFDFRVADLAMGSGHFLTAAIDHIERKMAAFLEEEGHQIPGVTNEIILLGNAAVDAMGEVGMTPPEGSSLLRRQIARRCIFGLDINPIAVELARVAIWIHTFVRGLPMSSLDHNLVCANSLTGIGHVEEAIDVLVPGRNGAPTFFDQPIEDALHKSAKILSESAGLLEINKSESRAISRGVLRAQNEAEIATKVFDAAVIGRIEKTSVASAIEIKDFVDLATTSESKETLDSLRPAHMPALFPEVFLRSNGGFDVLIGNPPWEELMVEEPKYWLKFSPGLLGLPMAQRRAKIDELTRTRPDLVDDLARETKSVAAMRTAILAGPYPGIGTGDIDLYRAFAWRNLQLCRKGGSMGLVFPRSLLNSAGNAPWRSSVLESADVTVTTLVNKSGWVFREVHGQYSIALVEVRKTEQQRGYVGLAGPFFDHAEFRIGRQKTSFIPLKLIKSASTGASLPQLPSADSVSVFETLRLHPRFDSEVHSFRFRPVAEFHATNDRNFFDTATEAGVKIPVLSGSSFNLWNPDFGEPFAWGDRSTVISALQERRRNQARTRSSAFYGSDPTWLSDEETLPCLSPRVAFRSVTNATNSRTLVACLVPGEVALVNAAPYLLRMTGTEKDEAYVLGFLSSIFLDWYARRYVELALNFHIFEGIPIPRLDLDDPLRERIINISGRLASCDKRFEAWSQAVGVEYGVIDASKKAQLISELNGLIARAYGLDRKQIEIVFSTFHRGWDYREELLMTLNAFDDFEGWTS